MQMAKYLSRFAIALTAVGVAYGVSALLRINHFVWTLLKDRYYQYVSIFLPLLLAWCCMCFFIRLNGKLGPVRASVAGVVGGYVCGLLAFLLLPMYGAHAAHQILTMRDLDAMLFLSPIIALSWVTGLIAVWVVWALDTKKDPEALT